MKTLKKINGVLINPKFATIDERNMLNINEVEKENILIPEKKHVNTKKTKEKKQTVSADNQSVTEMSEYLDTFFIDENTNPT